MLSSSQPSFETHKISISVVSNCLQILIFDIIEVVPEPGQPLTKNRFKQIYAKEQKGPITAITQVSGFLVSAVGQKVHIPLIYFQHLIT